MKIEECLILGAGLGTRMGEIGKNLPKILWPVFDRALLELQIAFARDLGCKRIFTNTHFLHEQIKDFIRRGDFPDVRLCHEPELLDIGGGIHNVAKSCSGDRLLILNGDLFYFFEKGDLEGHDPDGAVHLFCIPVEKGQKYNLLTLENKELRGIRPPQEYTPGSWTYSGVSVVNLRKLKKSSGPSAYFDTVANYREAKVTASIPRRPEHWDFGTLDHYSRSLWSLWDKAKKGTPSVFLDFCFKHGALSRERMDFSANAYGCAERNVLKLTKNSYPLTNPGAQSCIILETEGPLECREKGVYWKGLFSPG